MPDCAKARTSAVACLQPTRRAAPEATAAEDPPARQPRPDPPASPADRAAGALGLEASVSVTKCHGHNGADLVCKHGASEHGCPMTSDEARTLALLAAEMVESGRHYRMESEANSQTYRRIAWFLALAFVAILIGDRVARAGNVRSPRETTASLGP